MSHADVTCIMSGGICIILSSIPVAQKLQLMIYVTLEYFTNLHLRVIHLNSNSLKGVLPLPDRYKSEIVRLEKLLVFTCDCLLKDVTLFCYLKLVFDSSVAFNLIS